MFLYPCSLHIIARGTYLKKKTRLPTMKVYWLPSASWIGSRLFGICGMAPIYIPGFLSDYSISLRSYFRTIRLLKAHWIPHAVSRCHILVTRKVFPTSLHWTNHYSFCKIQFRLHLFQEAFPKPTAYTLPSINMLVPTILHWYISLSVSAFCFRL